MPCYDPRDYSSVEYRDNPETVRRLNRATRLLCTTCKYIEHQGLSIEKFGGKALDRWWKQHQLEDQLVATANLALRNKR